MTTIDGTEISAITIDGEDVTEVTMDGEVVWQAIDGDNLVWAVPQDAWDVYTSKPDPRSRYSTVSAEGGSYDNRGGDLAELIGDAAESNEIVDLGSGTYEMSSTVSTGTYDIGFVVGAAGDGSGSATIYYSDTALSYLFNLGGVPNAVLEGVTVDITEDTGVGDGIPDVGIINASISDEFWADDVVQRGARKRWQDMDGDGVADDIVGGYYSWKVNLTESDAIGLHRGIDLSDGLIYEPDADSQGNHHRQGIPFSVESPSYGLNVFWKCLVSDWANNGFYCYNDNTTGRNVLVGCEATNTSASAMRLGPNDEIVGGEITEIDPQGDWATFGLRHEGGSDVSVTGLRVNISDDQTRAVTVHGDAPDFTSDRLVLDVSGAGSVTPVRFEASGLSVDAVDSYWYDSSTSSRVFVEINDADVVTDDKWRVLSDNNDEVTVASGSTLTIDGTEYGAGTYTSSELGLESPLDDSGNLPEYYIDESARE